jgi:hypothetical protein
MGVRILPLPPPEGDMFQGRYPPLALLRRSGYAKAQRGQGVDFNASFYNNVCATRNRKS